jgi:hypothetical protein
MMGRLGSYDDLEANTHGKTGSLTTTKKEGHDKDGNACSLPVNRSQSLNSCYIFVCMIDKHVNKIVFDTEGCFISG